MRTVLPLVLLLTALCAAPPSFAQETQRNDVIIEKMSFKLVRGLTNAVTCIVELPKQIYLSARDRGAVGYAIGPVKGVGMTIYRAISGISETAFFMVPQPGYYDSMIDPDFVWKGWDEARPETVGTAMNGETAEVSDGCKEK